MVKNLVDILANIKKDKNRMIIVGIGLALVGIFVSMLKVANISEPVGCISYKDIKSFYSDVLSRNNVTLYDIKVRTIKKNDVCVHNVTLYIEEPNGGREKVTTTIFSKGNIIFMQGYDAKEKKLILAPRAKVEEIFTPHKMNNVTVDLYIMSMCPFGTIAAEKFFTQVPSGINFKLVPHFIVSASNESKANCESNEGWLPAGIYYNGKCYRSLHGNGELKTDIVLYNVYHSYGLKVFEKVYSDIIDNCEKHSTNETSLILCVKEVLSKNNLSWSELYDISSLPIIAEESKGVSASPTVYVNGVKIPYNPVNAWDKVLAAICNSYTNPPPACEKYLNLIEISS